MQKPPDDPPQKNPAAAELGRLGGLKGGAVRAQRMSPEERAEAARKAAAVRWARVAEERQSGGGSEEGPGRRKPKPFIFQLTPGEALEIMEARGSGGHQSLHRRLVTELSREDLTVTLDDRQFGELVRYMTQYESGGFQARLYRAFERSIRKLLRFD
jgi:hypothetical protein